MVRVSLLEIKEERCIALRAGIDVLSME